MNHRQVDWKRMCKYYSDHGILPVNYQIHDFNPKDLAEKLPEGAKLLKELIEDGKEVNVYLYDYAIMDKDGNSSIIKDSYGNSIGTINPFEGMWRSWFTAQNAGFFLSFIGTGEDIFGNTTTHLFLYLRYLV